MVADTLAPLAAAMIAAGVAALFAHSALAKLAHRVDWLRALDGYRLLPDALLWPVAAMFPWLELAVAAALLVPATRPAGLVAAAALMAAMALAIGVNLARGRTAIDCGCTPGGAPRPIGAGLMLGNLAAAALLLALTRAPGAPDAWLATVAGVLGYAALATAQYLRSFTAVSSLSGAR